MSRFGDFNRNYFLPKVQGITYLFVDPRKVFQTILLVYKLCYLIFILKQKRLKLHSLKSFSSAIGINFIR